MQRLDRNRHVTAIPYKKRGVPESAGLTAEDCRKAVWAVSCESGRRHRGAAAINCPSPPPSAPTCRTDSKHYPVSEIFRMASTYLVAANRRLLPADKPYCRQYPEEYR